MPAKLKVLILESLRFVLLRLASLRLFILQRLHPDDHEYLSLLRTVVLGKLTSAERARIEPIEALRHELVCDDATLDIMDYGAGRPGDDRSAETMQAGVRTTITVATACHASKPVFWAEVLFRLVRQTRPQSGIELGTCLGISAAYQSLAMQLNGGGTLQTLEGADALARMATSNLEKLGMNNAVVVTGQFEDTLSRVVMNAAPVDYVFIDGHHDESATLRYFEQLLPHLSENAVLVFDDIALYEGMQRAWRAITASESVRVSFDLRTIGICFIGGRRNSPRCYRLPLL